MNPHTGHLVDLSQLPKFESDADYGPLPPELREAAIRKLRGEAEAHVRLHGDGDLSTYRRSERRRIERARQKAAKRNR